MTSVVQSKLLEANTSLGAGLVLDSTPVQGNLLIGILTWSGSTGAVTYPWGATPDVNTGNGGVGLAICSKIAGASESTSVSFSAGTSRAYTLTVIEVAPTAGRRWLGIDQSATNSNGAATSLALGATAGLAESDDVAVAGVAGTGTLGGSQAFATAVYTNVAGTDTSTRGFTGYRILGTAGGAATTASWATSRSVVGAIAAYKQENIPASAQNSAFLALL